MGSKITVFDCGGETAFGSSYRKVRETEGSRNWDPNVGVLTRN